MTKAELIDAVAKSAALTKASAEKAVGGFLSAVTDALKKGDRVTLVGFGSFEVSARKARTGRNPQTGKRSRLLQPKFPSSALAKLSRMQLLPRRSNPLLTA